MSVAAKGFRDIIEQRLGLNAAWAAFLNEEENAWLTGLKIWGADLIAVLIDQHE